MKLRKVTTKKPASKKRNAIEIELAADIESDEIEKSKVIYIRKITPELKRNIYLAKKIKT
jgi:hypothetical protein